jgi:hypothetical protein
MGMGSNAPRDDPIPLLASPLKGEGPSVTRFLARHRAYTDAHLESVCVVSRTPPEFVFRVFRIQYVGRLRM